jgi:hypothetical protein
MVRLTHSRDPITTWKNTPAVSGDQGSADGQWHGAHGPTDVEWLGFPTQHHRDDFRVTRPLPGLRRADLRP